MHDIVCLSSKFNKYTVNVCWVCHKRGGSWIFIVMTNFEKLGVTKNEVDGIYMTSDASERIKFACCV